MDVCPTCTLLYLSGGKQKKMRGWTLKCLEEVLNARKRRMYYIWLFSPYLLKLIGEEK